MKKMIPLFPTVIALNIIICVAAETPQIPAQGAAPQKSCKLLISNSIPSALAGYLTEEKSKIYFEPIKEILKEKGYAIAQELAEDYDFSLAMSGSPKSSKKFTACDAQKSYESASYEANIDLVLWNGAKIIKTASGEGSGSVGCEEMSESKRRVEKENAELKSRSDSLLEAVKQFPECK